MTAPACPILISVALAAVSAALTAPACPILISVALATASALSAAACAAAPGLPTPVAELVAAGLPLFGARMAM